MTTETLAADVTPPTLRQELRDKLELEAALAAAPDDQALRARYFDLLIRIAAVHTGLLHALLPELGYPLGFRCGTLDILALAQVFRDGSCAFPLRPTPARILLLGAYAGYEAVFLARRFPDASLLCVEPLPANLRLLGLNTAPWPSIRILPGAAWHRAARLGVSARYQGDWGAQLHDNVPEGERTIQGYAVDDLLRLAGWDRVDLALCDIEGAERVVFANPGARWLRTLDALLVATHDAIADGSAATVAQCFDPALYDHAPLPGRDLYARHIPFRALATPPPPAFKLIDSRPGLHAIALQDTPKSNWGFFIFDGDSCQLHPNLPGEAPARAIFPRHLAGQTRFTATLHHAGLPAASIVFTVIVTRDDDGSEVARAQHTLAARESHTLELNLPSPTGPHRIILQTEMQPGSPHNYNAWSHWLTPSVS